jgi:hypothetical protein
MSIKGITDVTRLPRLGKIRTGIKKKSQKGNDYPEEVPYFVLNPIEEQYDAKGNVIGTRVNEHIEGLIKLFGEKPHEMDIVFPVDNDAIIADANLKWWGGNPKEKKASLVCRGNGEYACYKGDKPVEGLNDPSIPEDVKALGFNRICNKDLCPQAVVGHCKPNMNLMFCVPKLHLFGVFQIDTTSFQAMQSILSSLSVARQALRLQGVPSIVGVPMRLFRERTPNSKGGVNYILKVEVKNNEYREELKKLQSKQSSTLALGFSNIQIETPMFDEPNYDLIPQSVHGNAQTGEIEYTVEVEALPAAATAEAWVKDPAVVELFEAYGKQLGATVTEAKMLARARKHASIEELKAFIQDQLNKGAPAQ